MKKDLGPFTNCLALWTRFSCASEGFNKSIASYKSCQHACTQGTDVGEKGGYSHVDRLLMDLEIGNKTTNCDVEKIQIFPIWLRSLGPAGKTRLKIECERVGSI